MARTSPEDVLAAADELRGRALQSPGSYVDAVVPVLLAGEMMLADCNPAEKVAAYQLSQGLRDMYVACRGFPC
jgi:hypothetical protein